MNDVSMVGEGIKIHSSSYDEILELDFCKLYKFDLRF